MSTADGASDRPGVTAPRGAAGRLEGWRDRLPWLEAGSAARAELGEAALWLLLVAFGLLGSAILATSDVDLGIADPPLRDGWDPHVGPAVLVALTVGAGVVLAAARSGWAASTERLSWPALVTLGYVGSLAWSLALALAAHGDLAAGLRAPADLRLAAAGVGDHPLAFLATYTGTAPPPGAAGVVSAHPPGPVLLAWALGRIGLGGAVGVGTSFTLIGALVVPTVAVAVRSLCHETAARRLVPLLVLAPWSVWLASSPDAVTAALAALAVAVGVVGCEPGRRSLWWALGSGLLLGLTALFGYPPVWLGVAVAAAYFVRRRPVLNVVTGLGALVPLWLFYVWGFSWPDGLGLAGASRSGLAAALGWIVLDATVVVLAGGPVLVRAARRLRMTPGWPLLVGAAATMLFALVLGLAEGGVEETWLPVFPWLLVAAVAPRPRPERPGDTLRAGELPVLLMSLGALTALVLRLCLGSAAG